MAANLFVIRTPLQLFNAIEARDRFHADEQNILLLYFRRNIDRDQMLKLLDDRWHRVRVLPFRGVRQLLYPLWLRSLTRSLPRIATCYMGLASNIPLHLANTLRPKELRLLDDGNETLLQAGLIERWQDQPELRPSPRLRHRLMGRRLCRKVLDGLTYFTLYRPEQVPSERLIQNDYRCFQARLAQLPKTDEVCFIGSNLVPQYLAEDDFLRLISAVREHYGNRPVYYCAHRYESNELLEQIAARGLPVRRNATILEAAFLVQGQVPATVATFRSTAIDTLHQLYGSQREVISFDPGLLARPDQQLEFGQLLDDYRKRGIHLRQVSV